MAKTVTVRPSYESPLLKANHSPNQKLLKCNEKNDFAEDLFGKLPDEILVSIVSLLTLKEAARTSVLSRRWRYLWTFTTGSLDFDDSLLLWLMEYRKVIKSYSEESDRFVRWVNEVLKLHRGPTIDEFKVCFSVNEKHFKLDIENWIIFSLRKKVKRLVLDLAHTRESIRVIRQYTLTDQFLRSYHLDCLTTLCLNSVQVTGEVLEYILSNCPFLEVLHVEATESLVNLKPSGPLLKLKHLEIIHCFKLENFEISALNLVSFKYYGHVARILLGDVPNIVEASYSLAFACSLVTNCSQIPSYLFQVETLSLDLSLRLFEDTPRFPIFRNLRQLTLTLVASGVEPLRCCTSVLEASPFLHRFVVKLTYVDGPAGELKVLKVEHPHKFLSLFELRGFLGCTIDMELALYILSNAVSLQKIIIDTRDPYAEDMFWDERDPRLKEWGTARARELATRVPPWVELMLL